MYFFFLYKNGTASVLKRNKMVFLERFLFLSRRRRERKKKTRRDNDKKKPTENIKL